MVYLDVGNNNKQELRLSKKGFEFMPRDILQLIGKWDQ